jgi:hypothetical protein
MTKSNWYFFSKECPLESTYIAVINQSTNAAIDISRWRLVRRVDAKTTLQYTMSAGVQVKPGRELRIYSKFGSEVSQLSSSESNFSSSLYEKLILNDVHSMGKWFYQAILITIAFFYRCLGIGEMIETILLDDHGKEIASCLQQAESEWTE